MSLILHFSGIGWRVAAHGLGWCLRNSFSQKAADFVIHELGPVGPYVPKHEPSGFVFHHDFGGASPDAKVAQVNLLKSLDAGLQKYEFFAIRTKALVDSDHPISFVYFGVLKQAELDELKSLLHLGRQRRFFVNVLVREDADMLLADQCVSTFLVDDNAVNLRHPVWQGNHDDWDRVFREMPLRPGYHQV